MSVSDQGLDIDIVSKDYVKLIINNKMLVEHSLNIEIDSKLFIIYQMGRR